MTTFHMVRHGQADAPAGILNGRRSGVHLHSAGREQAERTARKLAAEPVDAIYVSPLERTRETADRIAARCNIEPQIETALLEVAFGDWTGKAYADLDPDGPWPRFNTFRSGTRIPGGELMLETQLRVVRWMLERRAATPDDTIVMVSHGDVIRSALVYFLGMPIDLMLRVEISPASITTLEVHCDTARVLTVNWMAAAD